MKASPLPPRRHPGAMLLLLLPLLVFLLLGGMPAMLAQDTPHPVYDPAWAGQKPRRILQHTVPGGAALVKAVAALQPGDRLEIAAGTYSVDARWDIGISGTAEAPIWIVAAKDAQVVITRPDEKQNVLNVGFAMPVRHLCLRGLEITGGGHGLRLGQCEEVWVDACHIHHTGGPCLSANSADTRRLHVTRNEMHHGGGHGEGMYLGANEGEHVMSESVIALNHVHDCAGSQGDGIEVKQGSWGNLVAENHVHDTQYPCITVYGTAGRPVNVIERNVCHGSGDHAMQVQGEAIVRNNVLIGAKGSAFASTDHQGKTLNLQVVHNTLVNAAHAFSGGSWNDREGMLLANNILYSRDGNALHFPNGSAGVEIRGNVALGQGDKHGSALGRGLEDLAAVSWDGQSHDARPAAGAPLEKADPRHLLPNDLTGRARRQPVCGAVVP